MEGEGKLCRLFAADIFPQIILRAGALYEDGELCDRAEESCLISYYGMAKLNVKVHPSEEGGKLVQMRAREVMLSIT